MRRVFQLVIFAVLICDGPISSAASENLLGLRDLLLRAKESQIDWRTAQYMREKTALDITAARSKFLPDLGVRSGYSYDWQSSLLNGEAVGSNAAIVSTWSLYDNGTAIRNFQISKLANERQRLLESTSYNQVSYEILERYLNHMLARRQREITIAKLKLLESQYRLTERQYRQGLKTRRDYQRLESETERAKLNLLRQEDDVKNSFEELSRYVGDSSLLKAPEQLRVVAMPELLGKIGAGKSYTSWQIDQVLSIRIADYAKQVTSIQKQEESLKLWPVLSVGGEFGYGTNSFAGYGESWQDQERLFGLARVQLNWNLWDWGGRRSVAQKARLDDRLASLLHDQSKLDAETLFNKLQRDNLRLQKSLAVVRRIYAIELNTFRDIEAEYRDGKASYLDLISSLDRRTQAELDVEQESISTLLNISQLLKMTGALYDACLAL